MASERQINDWLDACATYARTQLPSDHPKHLRYGGAALAMVRNPARRAADNLTKHDRYDGAEIRRRAEGGVDYEAHKAERAAQRERYALALQVNEAMEHATLEQIRAALVALGVNPTE